MKFYCIADEDTVRGFRLAGVDGRVVTSAPQAATAVAALAAQPDCGILILTEKVAAGIRPQLAQIRLERSRPLVIEIPGPEGPVPGRRSLRQFVEEAVGVRISLEKGP
ncbi:MAG: V-type ATP synthase subunit F [Verrucomicrobiota bacterium]|nr:V-type ATP synthase subunit F [Verrucomicrobiota bacterium]